MEWQKASGWTRRGFYLVVEWHESVFRFRIRRSGTTMVVAEGFARSLEAAMEKAERAADTISLPVGLPS